MKKNNERIRSNASLTRIVFVVTWRCGQSEVMRIARHRVALFQQISCAFENRLLGEQRACVFYPARTVSSSLPLTIDLDRRRVSGSFSRDVAMSNQSLDLGWLERRQCFSPERYIFGSLTDISEPTRAIST